MLIPLEYASEEVVEIVEIGGVDALLLAGALAAAVLKGHGVYRHTEDDSDQELANVHDPPLAGAALQLALGVVVQMALAPRGGLESSADVHVAALGVETVEVVHEGASVPEDVLEDALLQEVM